MGASEDFPPVRSTVLLLGCGHWENPGLDAANTQYDDLLAPERQAQVQETLDCLARFRPTAIAIERDRTLQDELDAEYDAYRQGEISLTASEHHQLGFRLAAACGHDRIHAIDAMNEPSGDLGEAFAFAEAHQPLLHRAIADFLANVPAAISSTESLLDGLIAMNSNEHLLHLHQIYLTVAQIGDGANYPGVAWVKGWYERNLNIFANITRLLTDPAQRLLIIYGAGHIYLLRQFLGESSIVDVVPTSTILTNPATS